MLPDTRVGRHLCRYEPPDIVLLTLVGDISGSDMRRLYDQVEAYGAERDYLLMLVDLSSAGAVSAEARMASIEERQHKGGGAAIFGASAHLRIIANFVIRAASLISSSDDFPVQFFANEAQARAWLAARRDAIERERQ